MQLLIFFCMISFVFAQTTPAGTTSQMQTEGSTTGRTTVGLHSRLHHRHHKKRVQMSYPNTKTASPDQSSLHQKPEEDESTNKDFEHEVKNVKDVYTCSQFQEDLCTRVTEYTPVGEETLCNELNLLVYYKMYNATDNVLAKIFDYGYLPPGKGVTITGSPGYSSVCKKIKR
jgi:hypothetical protein